MQIFRCVTVFTEHSDAKTDKTLFVILGFRGEVADNCALQGYYAASSGNCHCLLHNNPEKHSSQDLFLSAYTPARPPLLVIRSLLR
jgi:hypothetical protein